MTPLFADFDGDKLVDLLVPQGAAAFSTAATAKGTSLSLHVPPETWPDRSRGPSRQPWADFDRDGRLDLFVACVKGPNRYFRNAGAASSSTPATNIGLNQRVFNSRALSVVDLNRDGVLDLVLNNEGQESVILLGAKSEQVPPPAERMRNDEP